MAISSRAIGSVAFARNATRYRSSIGTYCRSVGPV
jgi:hypothetical protein